MKATHLEFLIEEPSMEAFLRALLPRMLPQECTFDLHSFQGKSDLLGKLQARLAGYSGWLPKHWRIVVVVDRDNDNCKELKQKLESAAKAAATSTRSTAGTKPWQVVNRIAIEELEAWYFGSWDAVISAFPKVSRDIPNKAPFRDPDAIKGGTWEAFERTLQQHGYFKSGLRKLEAGRSLGGLIDPQLSRSRSFVAFRNAVLEAVS